jgi:hypothetical protein
MYGLSSKILDKDTLFLIWPYSDLDTSHMHEPLTSCELELSTESYTHQ